MNRLADVAIKAAGSLRDEVIESVRTAIRAVRHLWDAILEWHRVKMLTDPAYPKTLLAISKAVVSLVVPRAVIAAAIITMLVDLLDDGPIGHKYDWDEDWHDI
ncbi:MAG: hypothetical protein O2943_05900 [Actinomycetota bacterium]|nr:hypothetical protein [Actinomycetota bacterium]